MAKATVPRDKPAAPSAPAPVAAPAGPKPWAPSTGVTAAASGPRFLPGDRPYTLVWLYGSYQLMDGRVVPLLSEFPLGPGLQGVGDRYNPVTKRREPVYDQQKAHIARLGGVAIPHDVDAGDGHPSYLVEVPGTGTVCHRLQGLVAGAPPLPPAPHVFADWLESLYGRVPGITPPTSWHTQKVMQSHTAIEDIVRGKSVGALAKLNELRERHIVAEEPAA